LIDVGLVTEEEGLAVYLLETVQGQQYKYLTLSHCWGDPSHMATKLTVHTLRDYSDRNAGISLDALPRTFRDAVEVTRRLGFRYLWIDSLCIIQSEPDRDMSESDARVTTEDWRSESSKMCGIYTNCSLTLAAASAKDSRDGLFYEKDIIKLHCSSYHLAAREYIDHFSDRLPLFSRGWVMQENILSPRTLFFGRQEVFWVCREQHSCECGDIWPYSIDYKIKLPHLPAPVDIPLPESRSTSPSSETRIPGLQHTEIGDEHQTGEAEERSNGDLRSPDKLQVHIGPILFDSIEKWQEIVTSYSQTKLTFPSDRLMAIQGIADWISQWRGGKDDYFFGCWKSSLHMDLLWTMSFDTIERQWYRPLNSDNVKAKSSVPTAPPPWRGEGKLFPTWSWASMASAPYIPGPYTFAINTIRIWFLQWHFYPGRGGHTRWDPKDNPGPMFKQLSGDPRRDLQRGPRAPPPYALFLEGILVPVRLSILLQTRVGFLSGFNCSAPPEVLGISSSQTGRVADIEDPQNLSLSEDLEMYCLRMFERESWGYASLVLLCVDSLMQVYERVGMVRRGDMRRNVNEAQFPPEWWQGSGEDNPPRLAQFTLV